MLSKAGLPLMVTLNYIGCPKLKGNRKSKFKRILFDNQQASTKFIKILLLILSIVDIVYC